MEKKDFIKFCHYYKGEKENPYDGIDQNKTMLWFYEKCWIDFNLSDNGRSTLADYIGDYSSVGLSLFEMQDDTPASLKALLFNRYAKTSNSMIEAVEPFKKFYKRYYK